jgi:hypothetical protein
MISGGVFWALTVGSGAFPPMYALVVCHVWRLPRPPKFYPHWFFANWTCGASVAVLACAVLGAWPLGAAYAVSLLLADVAGLLALESRKRVQLKDNRGQ